MVTFQSELRRESNGGISGDAQHNGLAEGCHARDKVPGIRWRLLPDRTWSSYNPLVVRILNFVAKGSTVIMADPKAVPIEVTCAQVKARLNAGDQFVFLDCREPNEHQTVSIKQAKLLPMSEIQNRLAELESQRGDDIVIHCHHGGRSLRVANWLRQQGFSKAQSMAGGIDQWARQLERVLSC